MSALPSTVDNGQRPDGVRALNAPQPRPVPNDGEGAVWDLVLADIHERDRVGTIKYGQRLTAGDGRDSLVDAYQEALDLAVYLRKAIRERELSQRAETSVQRETEEHTK